MNARGFTLVEMLVSLLVFALLASAGVAVMAWSADNQGLVEARMARLGEVQRARTLLRQDLAQASLRRVRNGAGQPQRGPFQGAAGGLGDPLMAFTRRGWENPEAAPRASVQRVAWRRVDDRLERLAGPALDGAANDPPQVVLRGVQRLSLAYHHRGQWSPAWPGGPDAVPDAVELRMEIEGIGELRQVFLLPGLQP